MLQYLLSLVCDEYTLLCSTHMGFGDENTFNPKILEWR